MHTPWGQSQTQKQLGRGVIQVETASHGGIHVSPTLNAHIHKAWRDKDGWYEEDCQWAVVALTFPNLFSEDHVIYAHGVAKRWFPDEYAEVFKVTVLPAESGVIQERVFYQENADRFIGTAAWGYRNNLASRMPVPEGMVGVCAQVGGHGPGANDNPERWFLVPADEYRERFRYGFVIDEARHGEWLAMPAAGQRVDVGWSGGLLDVDRVEDGRVVGEFYGETVRVPLDLVRSIHDGGYVMAA